MNSVMSVNSDDGDIVHSARWSGRPFVDTSYYTIRIENWAGNKVSGVELVHHKMYLLNNPTGIDNFSISDGYNMIFYNVGKRNEDNLISKFGIGIIWAHPDITLTGRDRFWNSGGVSGFYFSGVALQASLERWFYETTHHVFTVEGKLTAGYARLRISEDDSEFADVPHIAAHLTFGLGSKPLKTKTVKSVSHYILTPSAYLFSGFALASQ